MWNAFVISMLMELFISTVDSASCEIKDLYKMNREFQVKQSAPSKFEGQLRLRSCDDAVYYKTPNQELPNQIENWTISRSGKVTVFKKLFKYGEVKLGFTIEDPYDAGKKQESIIILLINREFNPTRIFLALNGRNINPTENLESKIQIPIEENTQIVELYIGGYNYDLHDTFAFKFISKCDYCDIQINQETNSSLHSPEDIVCQDIAQHNARAIKDSNSQLYYPCNLTIIYPGQELSWWSARLIYKPRRNFFGNDSFSFEIRCSHSLKARITIIMNVMANPCKNGGKCRGPLEDPSCSNLQRTVRFDFFNYTCQCPRGFTGDYCSIFPDSCLSSPCSPPLICQAVSGGSYKCTCPGNAISCSLPVPWQVSLIIFSVALLLFILGYILIRNSKVKKNTFMQSFHNGIFLLDRKGSDS